MVWQYCSAVKRGRREHFLVFHYGILPITAPARREGGDRLVSFYMSPALSAHMSCSGYSEVLGTLSLKELVSRLGLAVARCWVSSKLLQIFPPSTTSRQTLGQKDSSGKNIHFPAFVPQRSPLRNVRAKFRSCILVFGKRHKDFLS
jgi:hypothetical protein